VSSDSQAYDQNVMARTLKNFAELPIPEDRKGFVGLGGSTAALISEAKIGAAELSTPLAVLRDDALQNNVDLFAEWAVGAGVLLAPHAKTSMSPQIVARQLGAGAWGMTVATVAQASSLIAWGVRRLIIANQVVDPAEARRIANWQADLPGLELFVYVDSIEGANLLDAALGRDASPRPLSVLLEVGTVGGRAGVRTVAEIAELADAIAKFPHLRVVGCAGFEGVLAGHRSPASVGRVTAFADSLLEFSAAARVHSAPDEEWIVSAGGSVFPDLIAAALSSRERSGFDRRVVIRSGGYVTSDHGYLGLESPELGGRRFAAALTVRCRVLSRPQPTLAILGVGKRDIGSDLTLPFAERVHVDGRWEAFEGHSITAVNDQHAYLVPNHGPLDPRIGIGTLLDLGLSHPCTTFDRWTHLAVIDPDDRLLDINHTTF
jgi:D-serine dehydratase